MLQMIVALCAQLQLRYERISISRSSYKVSQKINVLYELIYESDVKCLSQLRMDTQTFNKLYSLLHKKGGLVDSKKMSPRRNACNIFVYFSTSHEESGDWFQF